MAGDKVTGRQGLEEGVWPAGDGDFKLWRDMVRRHVRTRAEGRVSEDQGGTE